MEITWEHGKRRTNHLKKNKTTYTFKPNTVVKFDPIVAEKWPKWLTISPEMIKLVIFNLFKDWRAVLAIDIFTNKLVWPKINIFLYNYV